MNSRTRIAGHRRVHQEGARLVDAAHELKTDGGNAPLEQPEDGAGSRRCSNDPGSAAVLQSDHGLS
jgi:hypothetical protein